MENIAKKNGRLLCFTPFVLYAAWTIYFFALVREEVVVSSIADHFLWVTAMIENYTSLWISLAAICTIHAAILLYLTVHIARIKLMDAGHKIAWMVFLVTFGAFALPVYWYYELRTEPDNVPVHASIA